MAFQDLGQIRRHHINLPNEAPFVGMNMRATEIEGAMLGVQLAKLRPMMARLRGPHDLIAPILARSTRFHVTPHNDQCNAIGLCVTFTREEEAIAFAKQRGVSRLHNSKHVYTNWKPILAKRIFNPRMNAWEWAQRTINYEVDLCSKTLDILGRTCRINLGERYPLFVMHHLAKRLAC
jgi:dTDP-4-amino-4,6-dideoxygalactose transaminase